MPPNYFEAAAVSIFVVVTMVTGVSLSVVPGHLALAQLAVLSTSEQLIIQKLIH